MPASAIDVSFCGAATTASTSSASASLIAALAFAGPVGIGGPRDHAQLGRDGAGCGMPFQHASIADHDRLAGVAHGGIKRSLEADLRSDACRVARGDGNSRLVAHAWTPVFYIGGIEQMRERLFTPTA